MFITGYGQLLKGVKVFRESRERGLRLDFAFRCIRIKIPQLQYGRVGENPNSKIIVITVLIVTFELAFYIHENEQCAVILLIMSV